MSKFGTKQIRKYGLGVKNQIHSYSKMGAKASHELASVSPLIGLFNPELGAVAGVGGTVGEFVAKGIEKATA